MAEPLRAPAPAVRLEQVPVRLLAHRQVLEGPVALLVVAPERSSEEPGAVSDHQEAAFIRASAKSLRRMSERRSQNHLTATSGFESLGGRSRVVLQRLSQPKVSVRFRQPASRNRQPKSRIPDIRTNFRRRARGMAERQRRSYGAFDGPGFDASSTRHAPYLPRDCRPSHREGPIEGGWDAQARDLSRLGRSGEPQASSSFARPDRQTFRPD